VDTKRSFSVVTIVTYRHRPVAEAELVRLRALLGPERTQMARLLTTEIRAVDELTEMLLPGLAVTASSAGVHAAMESRLTRALGHTFLQEVDRRLASSAAGIVLLTEGDTGSDLRVSLADKADHLLGRSIRPPEQLLLRRRS
jgi:hypothetical protein